MSQWKDTILMESELQAQLDKDLAYQLQQQKKTQEDRMWYEWAENNRFVDQDGQVLEGKQLNP